MKPKPRIKKQIEVRRHLTLPEDVKATFVKAKKIDAYYGDQSRTAAYIFILRQKKWTLLSIANALGLSRERVRQLEAEADPQTVRLLERLPIAFPAPELPTIEIDVPDHSYVVSPSDETLNRLKELQPLAQKVRYNHKNNREAAEEYTRLLYKAFSEEGVSFYHLAKLLGVTHGAIRFRLARYGYIQPRTGKSKVYKKIKQENRSLA